MVKAELPTTEGKVTLHQKLLYSYVLLEGLEIAKSLDVYGWT